jgi:hypothetical protein
LINGPKSPQQWFDYGVHTFATLLIGHSAAWCSHPGDAEKDPAKGGYDGHPVYWTGKGKKRKHKHKKLPDEKFSPDQNRCPTDVTTKIVGGCGRKEWVAHSFVLGRVQNVKSAGKYRRKKLWWGNHAGRAERDALLMQVEGVESKLYHQKLITPRFLFYADGCRTMLTTNLGEHYIGDGAKYFHGWVYSVSDAQAAYMCDDLFVRWIKGTKADPAPTEYDMDRFVQVYKKQAVRTRGRRRYHARLMNAGGVLNAERDKPDAKAEALE